MKGDLKTAAEYAQKVLDCGYFELADKSEIEDLVNGVLSPKETIWGLFSATFYTNVRANLYLTGSSSCLFLKSDHDDTYLADKEGRITDMKNGLRITVRLKRAECVVLKYWTLTS